MNAIGPPLLAAVVAFVVASLELITSSYPRTFSFIRKTWSLYAYAALYAFIAFVVQLGWNVLGSSVSATGSGLSNPWVRALVVGISVKAFMHIRLFNVTVGAKSFPIGIESLLQLVEPLLLDNVRFEYLSGIDTFIDGYAARFTDLAQVKAKIVERSSQILSGDELAGFAASVNQTTSVEAAMKLYLKLVGRKYFQQTFH
jgi:hypothetical protein